MEHIVDKHMIRVLRDIVMEYIDEYRIKYEHCVWELNLKIMHYNQMEMFNFALSSLYIWFCTANTDLYSGGWISHDHRRLLSTIRNDIISPQMFYTHMESASIRRIPNVNIIFTPMIIKKHPKIIRGHRTNRLHLDKKQKDPKRRGLKRKQ